MKTISVILVMCAILLSGCMYPKEMRQENQGAYIQESIMIVQNAVDQFRAKHRVLPLKNTTEDTPIYEQHLVDFKKLVDWKLISHIPAVAYENGGSFIFVLINVEEKPEVKVMDLVAYQKTVDLQAAVDRYQDTNGSLPVGEQVTPAFFRLDFDKLGHQAEQIKSPYTNQFLGFILSASGEVLIDYASDIAQIINKKGISAVDSKQDLRDYLVQDSHFVPAKSKPYYWNNGQPVISN